MKKSILFLALLLFASQAFSQEWNFRGFTENSTMEEVIEKEGMPDNVESESVDELEGFSITYTNKRVSGYNTDVRMLFVENKLLAGAYNLDIQQEKKGDVFDPKNFINAYNDLQDKLDSLYGDSYCPDPMPSKDIDYTKSEILEAIKGSPYGTSWRVGGALVYLNLEYEDKWQLFILYMSAGFVKNQIYSAEGL